MNTNQIVQTLKENGEDFEFYPTTQEIVDCLAERITYIPSWSKKYECDFNSILDIGCGNGSFFQKLDATAPARHNKEIKETALFYHRYGIEKSIKLSQMVPDNVIILGSNLMEQNLIDKKVGLIFCNPPYSEFVDWTVKILKEGNCEAIALVIPVRWKENERINEILKKRGFSFETLGTFDFENAERKARAKVDLVFITENSESKGKIKDPFDLWFDENFKIDAEKEKSYVYDSDRKERIKQELVKAGDTAEMLVEFYNRDTEALLNNYRSLEKLDSALFKELNVNIKGLKESLRKRLSGLKSIYWDMLFDRYGPVTSRLTTKMREKVTNKLNDNTTIDFTIDNIYQLTLWLIRNSNTMLDEQLSDFFYTLCDVDNIHRYKSNKRWSDDDWRYIKEKFKSSYGWRNDEYIRQTKNIQLDYRIVVTSTSNFRFNWKRIEMYDSCYNFLRDVYCMAGNLGFNIVKKLPDSCYDVCFEDWNNFNVLQTDGKVFANIKLYKNGNRHVKFCKEFMQKLNVEMARINGWVQDKTEAASEFDLTAAELERFWGSNRKLELSDGKMLLSLPMPENVA